MCCYNVHTAVQCERPFVHPRCPLSVVASFTKALGKVLGTSTKKAKPAQANPDVPTMDNTAAEADAQADEENKRRAASGSASTYLTSGGAAGLSNVGAVSSSGLLGS